MGGMGRLMIPWHWLLRSRRSSPVGKNAIVTRGFSNPAAEEMYQNGWPDEPELKERAEERGRAMWRLFFLRSIQRGLWPVLSSDVEASSGNRVRAFHLPGL